MVAALPEWFQRCDSVKAVEVELSLETAVLGLFEVIGQNPFHEFVGLVDSETLSVRMPADDVSKALFFHIEEHLVKLAWKLGISITRWTLCQKSKVELGKVDVR